MRHISICICTLNRQDLLKRSLEALVSQKTDDLFSFSIVVTDNDAAGSSENLVKGIGASSPVRITYCIEPRRSISHARNTGLSEATGDLIAFIDDDEIAPREWLLGMFSALVEFGVPGIFAPVRPIYDSEPPAWLIKGGFNNRPEHPTGTEMSWKNCRTGNVLIERSVLPEGREIFAVEFGAGASDIDLFRKLIEKGHTFLWCNEAFVHEVVPPNRWKRKFMLKRALLRGQLSLRHPEGRVKKLVTSMVAVPVYTLALPFLQIMGHHHFVNYLVKLFDHGGRLLAAVGLNPVHQREM